jgi:hypothetical protein
VVFTVDVLCDPEEALMVKKKTKGTMKKTVARKKVAKAAGVRRKTGKVAKKPHKAAAKTARAKPAGAKTAGAPGGMSLLSAWSSSRYSTY